jgi:hypothetical protein
MAERRQWVKEWELSVGRGKGYLTRLRIWTRSRHAPDTLSKYRFVYNTKRRISWERLLRVSDLSHLSIITQSFRTHVNLYAVEEREQFIFKDVYSKRKLPKQIEYPT